MFSTIQEIDAAPDEILQCEFGNLTFKQIKEYVFHLRNKVRSQTGNQSPKLKDDKDTNKIKAVLENIRVEFGKQGLHETYRNLMFNLIVKRIDEETFVNDLGKVLSIHRVNTPQFIADLKKTMSVWRTGDKMKHIITQILSKETQTNLIQVEERSADEGEIRTSEDELLGTFIDSKSCNGGPDDSSDNGADESDIEPDESSDYEPESEGAYKSNDNGVDEDDNEHKDDNENENDNKHDESSDNGDENEGTDELSDKKQTIEDSSDNFQTENDEFFSDSNSEIPSPAVLRDTELYNHVHKGCISTVDAPKRKFTEKRSDNPKKPCTTAINIPENVDLQTFYDVKLAPHSLDTSVIIYDLETTSLSHYSDILQISAIRFNTEIGKVEDTFNMFSVPTQKISREASSVNNLYSDGESLFKNTGNATIKLDAIPIYFVIDRFWNFVLHNISPGQKVLIIGYNNKRFDDNIMLHHSVRNLKPKMLTNVRNKVFTADLKLILSSRQSLKSIYIESTGDYKCKNIDFHDALGDSKALMLIMMAKNIRLEHIEKSCCSLESVIFSRYHPLLTANLVTPLVAKKINGISCMDYVSMTDEELSQFLRDCKLLPVQIRSCLERRGHKGK